MGVGDLRRYKNRINEIKSILESGLKTNLSRTIITSMYIGDGVSIEVMMEKFNLETYQEDGLVVIGIPLENLKGKFTHDLSSLVNFGDNGAWDRRNFLRGTKYGRKLSMAEVDEYAKDYKTFLNFVEPKVVGEIDKMKEGKQELSLRSDQFPRYSRRDILPIVHMDFDFNKLFYVSSVYAGDYRSNRFHYRILDIKGERKLGYFNRDEALDAVRFSSVPFNFIEHFIYPSESRKTLVLY